MADILLQKFFEKERWEQALELGVGSGSRWIPITGNSKGCCLSVLGENLW